MKKKILGLKSNIKFRGRLIQEAILHILLVRYIYNEMASTAI